MEPVRSDQSRGWARALGGWFVNQAAGAAVGVLIGAALYAWVLNPDRPSMADQIDSVMQAAAEDGFTISVNRRIDLHGTGEEARLLVFEPRESDYDVPGSDEIRVYDEVDGDLNLRFRARPRPRGNLPGYRFTVLGVGSYDRSDRAQVIATLDQRFVDGRPPHPVVLQWNVAKQSYELSSLLPAAPELPRTRRLGAWGRGARASYRRVQNIDLGNGRLLRDLRSAASIRIARGVLVAGYVVSSECNACAATHAYVAWSLDFASPNYGHACAVRTERGRVRSSLIARVDEASDIARAQRRVIANRLC